MAKDLLHTRFAQPVHDFFAHLAQGNDTSATVKELGLDGTKLTFSVDVRSRDVVKVHIPFNGSKTVVVYDVTANASGTVNLENPSPNDVNLTIDGPHGVKIKFNIGELIQLLVNSGILAA